jgi:hypothetical protein
MTPEEHQLMARMFAKQFQYIELLIRILQSRDIVQGDDLTAFLALVQSDLKRNERALQSVKVDYQKAAKEIGLSVRFPKEKRNPSA